MTVHADELETFVSSVWLDKCRLGLEIRKKTWESDIARIK